MLKTKQLLQSKKTTVQKLLAGKLFCANTVGYAFAPINFALIKYWGKRDDHLHLPITDSLSLTIDQLGTHTQIREINNHHDIIMINDQPEIVDNAFSTKIINYLNLFRPKGVCYEVNTKSDVAIASGLASSASGFAALIKALDNLYGWNLNSQALSILARLGSGSACRSLYSGFVLWQKGKQDDGLDSYAVPLPLSWPEVSIGLLMTSNEAKKISSRAAMAHTVDSSPLYQKWPQKVKQDLLHLQKAILDKDFQRFGEIVEDNAIFMHKTAQQATPPIDYDNPKTRHYKQLIQRLRQEMKINAYFTQDAGPHLKLIYKKQDESKIQDCFPEIQLTQKV